MNKCEILAIAEDHIHVLDKCVSMWIKISFTAPETPLTATYLSIQNTYHGNKNDIHNK